MIFALSCCAWMLFRYGYRGFVFSLMDMHVCVCVSDWCRVQMLVGLLEASDTRLIAAAAHTLGVLAQNDNSVKTAIHTQRGLAKLAQLLKVADAYEVLPLIYCFSLAFV